MYINRMGTCFYIHHRKQTITLFNRIILKNILIDSQMLSISLSPLLHLCFTRNNSSCMGYILQLTGIFIERKNKGEQRKRLYIPKHPKTKLFAHHHYINIAIPLQYSRKTSKMLRKKNNIISMLQKFLQ